MVSTGRKVTLEDLWDEIFILLYSPFFTISDRKHVFELAFSILKSSVALISVVPYSLVFKNFFDYKTVTKTRKRYMVLFVDNSPS